MIKILNLGDTLIFNRKNCTLSQEKCFVIITFKVVDFDYSTYKSVVVCNVKGKNFCVSDKNFHMDSPNLSYHPGMFDYSRMLLCEKFINKKSPR